MPNWCINQVTVIGATERLNELLGLVKSEESPFDFNKIISMPSTLAVEASSTAKQAYYAFFGTDAEKQVELNHMPGNSLKEKIDEIKSSERNAQLAQTYKSNKDAYGYFNWYDWSIANWGTKWNACEAWVSDLIPLGDCDESTLTIRFDTAWAFPEPIFRALAKKFPDITFDVTVDEEGGYFYGRVQFKGDAVISELKNGYREDGPFSCGDEE